MATLKEIAAIAGVNVATASRALNGVGSVNLQTKERIIEIAKNLNYFSAKKMVEYSVRTLKTVGVIFPELKCNSTVQVIDTIEEQLEAEGYSILLGKTDFSIRLEMQYLRIFEGKKVDGIILITSTMENEDGFLQEFRQRSDIPLVQVSTEHECPFYDVVRLDDVMAAELAMNHLLALGHKRIAYIGDGFSTKRQETYLEIIKKNGLHADSAMIRTGPLRYEEQGYRAASEILDTGVPLPTAIFAAYDNIAIGAMKAITDRGLRIPADISVIGIDDIAGSAYLYNALTTISNPAQDIGSIAARILLDKMQDKSNQTIQHVMIKPRLIARDTTSSPAKDRQAHPE